MKKLSIVVPVYNEKETLPIILKKLNELDLGKIKKEIVLVDDFSADGSREMIEKLEGRNIVKVFHPTNMGKGAALRSAFKNVSGEYVIIQDADLEYDPNDFKKLIKPVLNKQAQVVYGSRFANKPKNKGKLSFYLGNTILSKVTSILYGQKITDMETCYKLLPVELVKELKLQGSRFEIEPEITSKIIKRGIKIHEIPISYAPRSIEEGKKINWRDGVLALKTLWKHRPSKK